VKQYDTAQLNAAHIARMALSALGRELPISARA
jgi:hypothetical protein